MRRFPKRRCRTMVDGSFLRWPLPAADEAASRAVIGNRAQPGTFAMVSLEGAAEAVLYAPDAKIAAPPGSMHYDLNLVSDTGPATETANVVMLVAFDVPADL